MKKNILQELPELVHAGVITEEISEKISTYYESKSSDSPNRLFIVFGILGALLVGLGIILIIAHNWDNLNKPIKLFLALLPLLIGQGLCLFSLYKKSSSKAWRESSAVFLMLAVASSISIVSQVYNIKGNLGDFLFIWMLLSLPIIYLMRSSVTSLMFIVGITWYACEVSYFHFFGRDTIAWWYWIFFLGLTPYYYRLFKQESTSNFFYFHSWLLALSLTIALGMFRQAPTEFIPLAYLNLFASFLLFGQLNLHRSTRLISNGFLIMGSIGTITLLLSLSFDWYWEEIMHTTSSFFQSTSTTYAFMLSGLLACLLLYSNGKEKSLSAINSKSFVFLVVFILFLLGLQMPVVSQWLVNLLIFVIGVYTIYDGAMTNRISVLNYGLIIITALIICRFFDTDMSFVVRGLLFMVVGAGFFFTNYWMIRKRNKTTVIQP
ncbi:MAG TPA: DUF2157 domain-containing protein [Ohtaekwangia sp.]